MDARGQTLQDYVAGISVFVLTVAVVLGLLPSVVAPFQDGGGAADASIASRAGDQLVSELSIAGEPNVLDGDRLTSLLALDEDGLRDRFGLRNVHHVNVSLQTLNGTVQHGAAGASAASEETVSSARIVQVQDSSIPCRPACRMVVSVW
jgi:hypothetical protein